MSTQQSRTQEATEKLKTAFRLLSYDTRLYLKGVAHGVTGLIVLKLLYFWLTH